MRRTVALIGALMMVLMVALFGYYVGWQDGASEDTSTTYTAPATVVEVDEESKWITLVDWNGEAWCIRDDGFTEGEQVIVTFNDNQTESIYDDLIVEVRRANLVPIRSVE